MSAKWSLALAAVALCGCTQAASPPAKEPTVITKSDKSQPLKPVKGVAVTFKGKVVFQGLEGGFFGIIDDTGRKWLPLSLPKEMRRPGLVVEVDGTPDPDVMTIQQWGTPLRINSIKVLDDKDAVAPGVRY